MLHSCLITIVFTLLWYVLVHGVAHVHHMMLVVGRVWCVRRLGHALVGKRLQSVIHYWWGWSLELSQKRSHPILISIFALLFFHVQFVPFRAHHASILRERVVCNRLSRRFVGRLAWIAELV